MLWNEIQISNMSVTAEAFPKKMGPKLKERDQNFKVKCKMIIYYLFIKRIILS